MIIKIVCPCCNEKLNISIMNEEVVSVSKDTTSFSNKKEISEILKKHNIELALEGGEQYR